MSEEEPKEFIVATQEARTLPANELLTGRGFITGKSGAGKSVLEGTIVYTENGRKPIEDVEEGEKVLSLNKHDYQQEFREVLATIEHESDDLLRIKLEDGTELVGTKDHSFLTVEDLEIVPIKGNELEEGTWLPLARELPSAESVTRIDLAAYVTESNDLDIQDDHIRSGQKRDDRYVELNFVTGKVLGLYLAEGSFDNHLTVQISNVDEGVREFLGENGFNVYDRTCNRAFRPFGTFVETEFGRGAGGKFLPNWVFNAPDAFKAGLLSGYIDGDGTVGREVTASSKSPDLVKGIKELLRHFGISATIRDKFTIYTGEERRYQRLTVDAFCLRRLRDIVELSVEDKHGSLDQLVADRETRDRFNSKDMIPGFGPVLNAAARERGWTKRESPHRKRSASVHYLTRHQKAGRATFNRFVDELGIEGRARKFGRSSIQWQRVVDVQVLNERRTVFDLDVRLNNNFIADGVFVHNSNSMSVVAEELLDGNYNLLIVDTDGEYFGLKEKYHLLHVGGDDRCDVKVRPEHAERIAEIALERNVPVILDVSGYLEADEANALVEGVVNSLFVRENELRKPFLLIVEEMQEYLPQSGGKDDLAKLLLRVAKRGRKRGLGLCGLSQRPSAVDKDFITQCDWMVWHRLTWETDLDVVEGILGSEVAGAIPELDDGEAFLMTDWDETVERVQFRRKKTFDAGATPGLQGFERPELNAVSDDLIRELMGDAEGIELPGGNDEVATTAGPLSAPVTDEAPEAAGGAASAGTDAPGTGIEDELNLVVDRLERGEPVTDDPEELRQLLKEERKRNEILEAEVRELKEIIEAVRNGEGATDGQHDGEQVTEPRSVDLLEEQKPEGAAGLAVEAGLLVTFVLLRAVDGIKRLIQGASRRVPQATGNPPADGPRGYPITVERRTGRYRRAAGKIVRPVAALLAVGAVIAVVVWFLFLG